MKKIILLIIITVAYMLCFTLLSQSARSEAEVHAMLADETNSYAQNVISALKSCNGNADCLRETRLLLESIKPTKPDPNVEMLSAIGKHPIGGLFATRKAIVYAYDAKILDACTAIDDDNIKKTCITEALAQRTQREERVGNIVKSFGNGLATVLGVMVVK